MEMNLWIPFWVGLACFVLSIPFIALLPDTRRPQKAGGLQRVDSAVDGVEENQTGSVNETTASPNPNEVQSYVNESTERSPLMGVSKQSPSIRKAAFQHFQDEFRKFSKLILASRNVSLIFTVFLVTTLARCVLNIIIQYISYRYFWTFAQVSNTQYFLPPLR